MVWNLRCSLWKRESLISDKQAEENICSPGERLIDTANLQLLWSLALNFHPPSLVVRFFPSLSLIPILARSALHSNSQSFSHCLSHNESKESWEC